MVVRAIFFDLDDTLCDTIGTRAQRARKAFEWLCVRHPHLVLVPGAKPWRSGAVGELPLPRVSSGWVASAESVIGRPWRGRW
jgi:hypothetical protein